VAQFASVDDGGALDVQPAILAQPPLPDHPQPHRVVDKKFMATMGALGATESIRFTTRQLVLENELSAGAPLGNQRSFALASGFQIRAHLRCGTRCGL